MNSCEKKSRLHMGRGLEGSSAYQGHCLVVVVIVSSFTKKKKNWVFPPHTLEQWFSTSRELASLGVFGNAWSPF